MENPALYERVNGPQRRDANDFANEFCEIFGKISGRCFDIGSGPGDVVVDFILPKLMPMATVVCSDISEPMVKFGKEKYKDNSRLSFIQLDIESPDLPKNLIGQFDIVTSIHCLHWCQDTRQAFENIFTLLRPGGTTVVTFIADYPPHECYKYLAKYPRYQPYMKDADRYIPVFQYVENKQGVLETLVKDVGFEVVHCGVRDKNFTFIPRNMFTKFTLALNPFVERMPLDLKEEYKKDLAEESVRQNIPLQNKNSENEYGLSCTYSAFVVYLRKPTTK